MYNIVRKIPTVIFCKVKIRFLLNAILHENILDFYPNLLKIYFPLEEPGKNEYTYFNKYIAQEGKNMKKKIMSLILSAVLVAGAGMPATAYGEDFYSESAETSCGEEENSVVDDDSTENASAEGTDNSWEEDQGNQTDPEAGFVDGGFGDMEEVQGGFEENPVEDAAGEDELWTDEEAEEITDLDVAANGFATAKTISTNTTYSTNLTKDVRERWFKFYVSSAGNIALGFKHDFVDSSDSYWRATIYADGNHEELASYSFQGEKILYISVMNNLSVDCDCVSTPAVPKMKNVGILASLDPVALDQACVDLVLNSPDDGNKDLVERITSRRGTHILYHAALLGAGSRNYQLIDLDHE